MNTSDLLFFVSNTRLHIYLIPLLSHTQRIDAISWDVLFLLINQIHQLLYIYTHISTEIELSFFFLMLILHFSGLTSIQFSEVVTYSH